MARGSSTGRGPCALQRDALYVCDQDNHRIVVLGTDLSWRYTFGRKGSGDGEFAIPLLTSRRTVVSCTSWTMTTDRVQAFAPDRRGRMRFARAFGGKGDAPGQFQIPWGVAVVRGLLVVSDYWRLQARRLQVLTPKGVPLQVLAVGDWLTGLCSNEDRGWVCDAEWHTSARVEGISRNALRIITKYPSLFC